MHFNLPHLTIILCLLKLIQSHSGDDMDIVFSRRTYADWARIWHQETHSRCREKVRDHLIWACEKDIYKLTRRNDDDAGEDMGKRHNQLFQVNKKSMVNPWITTKEVARQMLRTRRNGGKGITQECCTRAGCTWEEFAEYCPSNKRRHAT